MKRRLDDSHPYIFPWGTDSLSVEQLYARQEVSPSEIGVTIDYKDSSKRPTDAYWEDSYLKRDKLPTREWFDIRVDAFYTS